MKLNDSYVATGIGGVLLFGALIAYFRRWSWLSRTVRTVGVLEGYERMSIHRSKNFRYAPIVRSPVSDAAEQTHTPYGCKSPRRPFAEGELIYLHVDPENAQFSEIEGFRYQWFGVTFALSVGSVLLMAGLVA